MLTRRLVLRREKLTALDANDLLGVVGATHIATDCGCISHGYSCDACGVPSLPLNTCACYTFRALALCVYLSVTC